jgi:GNAT superfamily N-acetyltransferase
VRLEAADGETVIVRSESGERVGSLRVELAEGVLVIQSLEIEPALRGYGLGSEAGGLVREAAERESRTLRAWAPGDNGLAVYFWIRMGLRPLPGEGAGGGLWFERTVE